MPKSELNTQKLQGHLKAAEKNPLAFAICLGDSPKDHLVIIDRKKSAAAVLAQAKQERPSSKRAYGTISSNSGTVTLNLIKDLQGIAKTVRKWFASHKIICQVVVLAPDGGGNAYGDAHPISIEPERAASKPADTAAALDALTKQMSRACKQAVTQHKKNTKLHDAIKKLDAQFDQTLRQPKPAFEELRALIKRAQQLAAPKPFQAGTLNPPPGVQLPKADADLERMRQQMEKTQIQSSGMFKNDPGRKRAMAALYTQFQKIANSELPDFDRLRALQNQAKNLMDQTPLQSESTGAPKGRHARLERSVKQLAQVLGLAGKDIDRLADQIELECADLPGARRVRKALAPHRKKLDGVLREFETRAKATQAAGHSAEATADLVKFTKALTKALRGDTSFAKIDDNPFLPVKAHRSTVAVLGMITANLSA